jgi:tetratricopeptide (TPR) repeat protein
MVRFMREVWNFAASKSWLQIAAIIAIVAWASACSTQKALSPPPTASSATDTNSTAAKFQHALDLLQNGDAQGADVELHDYLRRVPENTSAMYLIGQIETPLPKLFPQKHFSVKVAKDETLSSLAHTYLGNSLAFYGLARYNGMTVPSRVAEGQSIRIPKTPDAMQALARIAAVAAAPLAPGVAGVPLDGSPSKPEMDHRLANEYYEQGLVAFQRQDLDAAIVAWDKVLAIDPNYKNAQLSRAQAIRLKSNLANLRK